MIDYPKNTWLHQAHVFIHFFLRGYHLSEHLVFTRSMGQHQQSQQAIACTCRRHRFLLLVGYICLGFRSTGGMLLSPDTKQTKNVLLYLVELLSGVSYIGGDERKGSSALMKTCLYCKCCSHAVACPINRKRPAIGCSLRTSHQR